MPSSDIDITRTLAAVAAEADVRLVCRGCQRKTDLTPEFLARHGHRALAEVFDRLVCKRCRRRAGSVLVEARK